MRLPIICASVLLAACQSHYRPAEGDRTAAVTFTSDNIAVQPMICVPGEGFVGTEFMVSQQPFGSDAFNEINKVIKKQPEVEATVPAGDSIKLGFSYLSKERTAGLRDRCTIATLFTPETGARYDARFSLAEGECALTLTRGGAPVPDAVLAPWTCQ